MKRSIYIVKQELCFLKSLVEGRVMEIGSVDSAVEKGLDLLAIEHNLSRQELIKIILVNFRYSVLEAIKESSLEFNFARLSLKEICYFYFMHRLRDSAKYLS